MSRGGSGGRQRVRTARGRTAASTRWLERQLNDPYVRRARAEGYRSRAAYKLIEIDDKYRLLKPGGRVVDLGAAPGGCYAPVTVRDPPPVPRTRPAAVSCATADRTIAGGASNSAASVATLRGPLSWRS